VLALALMVAVAWQGKSMFKRQPRQGTGEQSVQARSSQAQPEVTLYSASWCGYCKATREFFKDNGIRFTEHDVETTAEGADGYRKLGGGGVPVILVGEETVRGFSEEGLRQMLGPWMKES
jgi:glutaredoxin